MDFKFFLELQNWVQQLVDTNPCPPGRDGVDSSSTKDTGTMSYSMMDLKSASNEDLAFVTGMLRERQESSVTATILGHDLASAITPA